MTQHGFSQVLVTSDGRIVGSINETQLYTEIVRSPDVKHGLVERIMQPAFPFADISNQHRRARDDADARESRRSGARLQE